jgi:uncharacterized protein YwbE
MHRQKKSRQIGLMANGVVQWMLTNSKNTSAGALAQAGKARVGIISAGQRDV